MSKPYGFELAGEVWVDSGTLMIGDPCYLDGGFDYEKWTAEEGDHMGRIPGPSDFADPGKGGTFAAYTAYGDGVYPVYVKRDRDGKITAMLVDTDPDEDLEEIY